MKNETERKPVIAVLPLWDEKRESLWMYPGYLEGVREAGGIPLIFPFTESEKEIDVLLSLADGVLFTGGDDVDPKFYGEIAMEGITETCSMRDGMEQIIFDKVMKQRKPVLGICRGHQFFNCMLGGSLYQDLVLQFSGQCGHRMSAPYDQPFHTVSVPVDSPLHALTQKTTLSVNSYHHQGIKVLAPSLRSMAIAPDGLVEACYMPDYPFFWSVQWHPEFSHKINEDSRRIFSAFVNACL